MSRRLRLSSLAALALALAAAMWLTGLGRPPEGDPREAQIEALVADRRFDFNRWLWRASASKVAADLGGSHDYLPEQTAAEVVRGYLVRLGEVHALERELERVFADPAVTDPLREGEPLRRQIAADRAELAAVQPLVESILQEQVSAVLLDEGFALGGRVWPPVRMRLSRLPARLVVSPREEIRQLQAVSLATGLPVEERAALEAQIFDELDLSAYVTDIGGLGTYPAMVLETTDLRFLVDVTAHEWAHTWLGQFPLGWRHDASPEVRTINETVAGIVGTEVGLAVLARYYPDLLPPPPLSGLPPAVPADPPPFDFRQEMRETRIRADELLAAGEIEAAEAYMEARRQHFVAHGYHLRVLNQAYFAFNGAYADVVGAAGADPVGPLVLAVREATPDLRTFLRTLAWVTSLAELEAAAANLELGIDLHPQAAP